MKIYPFSVVIRINSELCQGLVCVLKMFTRNQRTVTFHRLLQLFRYLVSRTWIIFVKNLVTAIIFVQKAWNQAMCRILKNLWPSLFKMSSAEWAFFTPEQNECGELEDPKNGKLACKLKQGTAYCRVKCYKGFMYENTKERSQWCKNGRWMPRRTPRCVPDPFTKRTASKNSAAAGGSYAYGRSQRKN